MIFSLRYIHLRRRGGKCFYVSTKVRIVFTMTDKGGIGGLAIEQDDWTERALDLFDSLPQDTSLLD